MRSMRNFKKSKSITEMARSENLPLQVVQLDVNDDSSVKDAIDKIVKREDRRISKQCGLWTVWIS